MVMRLAHLRLNVVRLALVAAALVVAVPAVRAFTMDTIANSGGGARYIDLGDRLEDIANGKTTTTEQQGVGSMHFDVGPSRHFSGSNPVGAPPDQRFMDR
jgi:hypothetical protein